MKCVLLALFVLIFAIPVMAPAAALAEPADCGDAIDNDGDGLTDYPDDPGCLDATDNDETDPPPPPTECSDGLDNDGDGATDFPEDPSCDSPDDIREGYACPSAYSDDTVQYWSCLGSAVTIRYNSDRDAFGGVYAIARRECAVDAEVILKQRRPGKDRALASVLTSRRGTWRVPMGGPVRGRFYALAVGRGFQVRSGAEVWCPGDRSVTIRVGGRG